MEKLKNVNSILCIIIAIIIIIAGGIVCLVKGFNIELFYQNKQSMVISNNTGLDRTKIKEIVKSVLSDRKVEVKEVERFGNSLEIISTSISEDEKKDIVQKINDEIENDINLNYVEIKNIPATRIRDILKPYIVPGIISFVIVITYFIIIYHKIGVAQILLKSILIPIIAELTYYAIIAITRIPFGRITNAIALGIYIVTIGILTVGFQKAKENLTKGEE